MTSVGKLLEDDDYLALLRPMHSPPPGRLAAALAILQRRSLAFDFAMRWPGINSDQTYCAGFVSQMYRLAGLPDPFPPSLAGKKEPEDDWVAEHLGIDPSVSVSPNAPLFLSEFKLVAQYKNTNKQVADKAAINAAIAAKIIDYVAKQHLVPVVSGLGDKLVLDLISTGLFDADDIPVDNLSPGQRAHLLAVGKFSLMVDSRVGRTLYLNDDEEWSAEKIAALTDRVADAYRNKYFVREGPP